MIFRCFQPENLKLLNLTALDVNEAFFLATHTPLQLARMRGGQVSVQNALPFQEEELLATFRNVESTFEFAIVRGTTGSGKSHLIRWLYHRLSSLKLPNTKLFLIPRAGANLRQIIERIIDGMEGKFFDEIRSDLVRGQEKLTSKGLREMLLDTLAVQVDPSSFKDRADPLAGLSGDARDNLEYLITGLPDLFRDRRFRRQFSEEGNIIDELVNLTIGTGGSRAGRERPRQFTEKDFQLTEKLTPEDLRRADTDETLQFALDLTRNPELRQEAARYVNSCLPATIQSLLDIRGTNFTDIFRKVRRQLGPKQQLLVLIEDIAAFEFIDRQLLESLIEQPDAELCPLKSAIGVTDGYFERIDPTHLERSTLLITLDVPSTNPKETLAQFASAYFNALRTPLPVLQSWADADTQEPLPSACLSCSYRVDCHASFTTLGQGDAAIGLFPFNRASLSEMQKATHGTHAGEFNPRSFLDAVIRATLQEQATNFAEGKFPSLVYRKQFGTPLLTGAKVEALKKQYRQQYEQAQVIQELWGDVPAGVYETFGVKTEKAPATTTTSETPVKEPSTTQKPSTPTTTAPKPVYPRWVKEALDSLDGWYNGREMSTEARDSIRRLIRSVIFSTMDWSAHGLNESDWNSVFDPAAINLEGQAKAQTRALSIMIPRVHIGPPEIPTALALQGLLLAHHFKSWDFEYEGQDGLYYLQLAIPIVEALSQEVLQKILQYNAKGQDWNPLPAALEMLNFAALLQGHIDSTTSLEEAISALLTDRSWESNPIGPDSNAFEKLFQAFAQTGANQGFALVRQKTLALLNRSRQEGQFTCDAQPILAFLRQFQSQPVYPIIPLPSDMLGEWQALKQLRRATDQHLKSFLQDEVELLTEWSADVRSSLGDRTAQELIQQTELFLKRTEAAKVFRSPTGTSEEIRKALRDLLQSPLDATRQQVLEILQQSQDNLPETGPIRIDVLLPKIARLRHDVLRIWEEFREALAGVLNRTEQQLERSTNKIQTEDVVAWHETIEQSLQTLTKTYDALLQIDVVVEIPKEELPSAATEAEKISPIV